MLKNITIAKRLSGALALLIAINLGVAALAILKMGSMRHSTEEITSKWLPSFALVNAMSANTADFRLGEYGHAINSDSAVKASYEKEMTEIRAALEKNRDAYVELISSDKERRIYDQLAAGWKSYIH